MTLEEVYDYYDNNWSKMTRELKLGTTTLRNWKTRGFIPIRSQMLIEKRTGGLFKASIEHAPTNPDVRAIMSREQLLRIKAIVTLNLMAYGSQPVTPFMIEEFWERVQNMILDEIVCIRGEKE